MPSADIRFYKHKHFVGNFLEEDFFFEEKKLPTLIPHAIR